MRLDTLIEGLGVRLLRGDLRGRISDISERVEEVRRGTLFLARAGASFDARVLIPEAVERGCAGVLVEEATGVEVPDGVCLLQGQDLIRTGALLAQRFFGEPSRRLQVVGITGTNGKTTVAHVLCHLLDRAGIRCGLIGTVETRDGTPPRRSTLTTPMGIDLARSLSGMVRAGIRACAMEVSSHALVQGRTAGVRFRQGVFTNLSGDHLDYHGTMERYADAKRRLFDGLASDALAVINGDDRWSAHMVARCAARVIRCGEEHEARVRILHESLDGLDLILCGRWGEFRVRTRMIGAHNAMNLLQACCCAHGLGVDGGALRSGIASLTGVPGRLERVAPGVRVFVDFAHTDDALGRVIASLRRAMEGGRLIVVFGCGGDRDRSKRPRMGRAACGADLCVLTSDNPRSEDPMRIIEDTLSGMDRSRTIVEPDRRRAIERALAQAGPEDVVLIAGKGHECEQIARAEDGTLVRTPFDDRCIARRVLSHASAFVGGV